MSNFDGLEKHQLEQIVFSDVCHWQRFFTEYGHGYFKTGWNTCNDDNSMTPIICEPTTVVFIKR